MSLLKYCYHPRKMKDSRLPKNNYYNSFFQNHNNGPQSIPGPESEYICEDSNTFYDIYVLLFFAAESPGLLEMLCFQMNESVTSHQGKVRCPLAGESASDHLLACPWKGGVLRRGVVQSDCRGFPGMWMHFPKEALRVSHALQTYINTDQTFWFFRLTQMYLEHHFLVPGINCLRK